MVSTAPPAPALAPSGAPGPAVPPAPAPHAQNPPGAAGGAGAHPNPQLPKPTAVGTLGAAPQGTSTPARGPPATKPGVILAAAAPPTAGGGAGADGGGDDDDDDDGEGSGKKGCNGANVKRAWSAEEDATLLKMIEVHGAQNWSTIASHLEGRVGKQCRERWFNHLCPEVKKGDWTAEEDRIIMESVRELGTCWSKIVKLLPGRTDNAIKNRYNSTMRKNLRAQLKPKPPPKPAEPPAPAPASAAGAAGGGAGGAGGATGGERLAGANGAGADAGANGGAGGTPGKSTPSRKGGGGGSASRKRAAADAGAGGEGGAKGGGKRGKAGGAADPSHPAAAGLAIVVAGRGGGGRGGGRDGDDEDEEMDDGSLLFVPEMRVGFLSPLSEVGASPEGEKERLRALLDCSTPNLDLLTSVGNARSASLAARCELGGGGGGGGAGLRADTFPFDRLVAGGGRGAGAGAGGALGGSTPVLGLSGLELPSPFPADSPHFPADADAGAGAGAARGAQAGCSPLGGFPRFPPRQGALGGGPLAAGGGLKLGVPRPTGGSGDGGGDGGCNGGGGGGANEPTRQGGSGGIGTRSRQHAQLALSPSDSPTLVPAGAVRRQIDSGGAGSSAIEFLMAMHSSSAGGGGGSHAEGAHEQHGRLPGDESAPSSPSARPPATASGAPSPSAALSGGSEEAGARAGRRSRREDASDAAGAMDADGVVLPFLRSGSQAELDGGAGHADGCAGHDELRQAIELALVSHNREGATAATDGAPASAAGAAAAGMLMPPPRPGKIDLAAAASVGEALGRALGGANARAIAVAAANKGGTPLPDDWREMDSAALIESLLLSPAVTPGALHALERHLAVGGLLQQLP